MKPSDNRLETRLVIRPDWTAWVRVLVLSILGVIVGVAAYAYRGDGKVAAQFFLTFFLLSLPMAAWVVGTKVVVTTDRIVNYLGWRRTEMPLEDIMDCARVYHDFAALAERRPPSRLEIHSRANPRIWIDVGLNLYSEADISLLEATICGSTDNTNKSETPIMRPSGDRLDTRLVIRPDRTAWVRLLRPSILGVIIGVVVAHYGGSKTAAQVFTMSFLIGLPMAAWVVGTKVVVTTDRVINYVGWRRTEMPLENGLECTRVDHDGAALPERGPTTRLEIHSRSSPRIWIDVDLGLYSEADISLLEATVCGSTDNANGSQTPS